MEKVKKSAVRIYRGLTTTDLEQKIENKDAYVQSISISHDEHYFYAAVIFNVDVLEN